MGLSYEPYTKLKSSHLCLPVLKIQETERMMLWNQLLALVIPVGRLVTLDSQGKYSAITDNDIMLTFNTELLQ